MHGYVSGGSEDQQALHANRDAFAAWAFRPQALVDVSARSQAVDLFGRRLPAPLGISPMGVAALCHHDGDLALARSHGAHGETVTRTGDFAEALARARGHTAQGRPALIELQVSPKALTPQLSVSALRAATR